LSVALVVKLRGAAGREGPKYVKLAPYHRVDLNMCRHWDRNYSAWRPKTTIEAH